MATWTRDELILTLDLYLESGRRILEPHDPRMDALVGILNRLRALEDAESAPEARTAGSIKAKMTNLRAIDPHHPSSGWGNGGRLDQEVWNEFADDDVARSREVIHILRRIAAT